jgi:hypothetical protein
MGSIVPRSVTRHYPKSFNPSRFPSLWAGYVGRRFPYQESGGWRMWLAKHGSQLLLPGNAAGELIGLPPPHIAQPTPRATWRPARPRPLQCRGPGLSRLQCCARSPPPPARIGPVEFGGMVAARCPRAALSWNLLAGIEAPASRGAVVMGRRHLSRNADCDAIRYASTLSRSVFRYRHGERDLGHLLRSLYLR